MNRFAVIDLGTNTFHLLVADVESGGFREIFRKRTYVYLGENGVEVLGQTPLHRAFETLRNFKTNIDKLGVEKVTAFGTAALRTASNGKAFIDKVRKEIGIEIQTISGDREANLIYLGVRQAVPMTEATGLIMDIGGGSVEFILANQHKIFWKQSFPIGVSVLYNRFHQHEPITNAEILALDAFLNEALSPLFEALKRYPTDVLIGASGTFDVITAVIGGHLKGFPNGKTADITRFESFYQRVVHANLTQRLAMTDVPEKRSKLIVVALILVHFILKKATIQQMLVSEYALKEGVLWELANE